MITNEDTAKIIEANHKLFYDKDEVGKKFEKVDIKLDRILTSVDSFAVGTKKNFEEILVVNNRLDNDRDWIQKAAPKIGIEFKL